MDDVVKVIGLGLALGWMILAAHAETEPDAPAMRVAPPAPMFELSDATGAVVKLAECRSAAVIVTFFLSRDRPSARQIQSLGALRKKYGSAEVAVFGVALDTGSDAELRTNVAERPVDFPMLRCNRKTLDGFGGITAVPTTFVLDQNRNIIQRHVGFVEPVVLEGDLKIILRK